MSKEHYSQRETLKQRKQRLRKNRRLRKTDRKRKQAIQWYSMITLHFDGAIDYNPDGRATYGWVISRDGDLLEKGSGIAIEGKGATNNIAEYVGLIMGLEAASRYDEPVKIYGDSQIVIRALKNRKRPGRKYPHILRLWSQALSWIDKMEVTLEWVPREKNYLADDLSMKATGYPIYQYEDLYDEQLGLF